MRTILKPAAVVVAMLLAAVPAAALACQLACAMPHAAAAPGQAAAPMHHHDAHAMHTASPAPGGRALQASHAACEHTGESAPALVTSIAKVAATASAAPAVISLVSVPVQPAAVSTSAHSPPGGRSAPLALRI